MTNPLLSPAENAQLTALRSNTEAATYPTATATNVAAIDWQRIHALIPWIAALAAWGMWAMFLLIPTVFGLHYAGAMPAMNNAAYVMMGLSLCLAASVAAQAQHGVRAIAFTFTVLLLSYWF